MGKGPKLDRGICIVIMIVVMIVIGSLGALFLTTRGYNLKIEATYPEIIAEEPAFNIMILDVAGLNTYEVPFNVYNTQTSKTLTFEDGKPNILGQITVHVLPVPSSYWGFRLKTDNIDDFNLTINVAVDVEIQLWDNNDQHVATLNFVWELA